MDGSGEGGEQDPSTPGLTAALPLSFPTRSCSDSCRYWCVSQHYLNMTQGVFLKIKGTLPKISTGVFDGPARAADLDSYDMRYLSLT